MTDLPGQSLGNYELLRVIGQGGAGVVYEAKHKLIGKPVAIKLLNQDVVPNQEIAQRFFNEARAVNEIQHENIIDISDYGFSEDGRPYFIMELLHGRPLAEVLQGGEPLAHERASSIAQQILRALEATHKAGIIHRDLKPENIFLIQRGQDRDFVKLLDFGVAKMFRRRRTTKVGLRLGTPAYMSPEQIEGEGEVDHRADLYSVGVLLFELFTGKQPFPAESATLLFAKRMTEASPSPRSVNPALSLALEGIILRALERDPARRFQSAAELLEALEGAEQARQLATHRLKKRPTYSAWMIPLASLALVGLGLALWSYPQAATVPAAPSVAASSSAPTSSSQPAPPMSAVSETLPASTAATAPTSLETEDPEKPKKPKRKKPKKPLFPITSPSKPIFPER